VLQQSIEHGYQEFLARVAAARRMSREQVDHVARGRIWSGEDAKGLGLVDQLGGLDQAVASAARRAKLAAGYRVWYVEKDKTFRERVVGMLAASALELARSAGWTPAVSSPAARTMSLSARLRALESDLVRLERWNDPRGIYAHCLCAED